MGSTKIKAPDKIVDVDVDVERWVIVSMVVMCDAITITEHGRIRPGLSNAPAVMENDSNRTEQ